MGFFAMNLWLLQKARAVGLITSGQEPKANSQLRKNKLFWHFPGFPDKLDSVYQNYMIFLTIFVSGGKLPGIFNFNNDSFDF